MPSAPDAYFLFVTMGIGILFPWNALITSTAYFQLFLGSGITFVISNAYTVSLFLTLLATCFKKFNGYLTVQVREAEGQDKATATNNFCSGWLHCNACPTLVIDVHAYSDSVPPYGNRLRSRDRGRFGTVVFIYGRQQQRCQVYFGGDVWKRNERVEREHSKGERQ